MLKDALTALTIENLQPKASAYDVVDGGGLVIRVLPSGSKEWSFLYRFDGKRKRLEVSGPKGSRYPALSLKQAREIATKLRSAVKEGRDPGAERRQARQEKINARREYEQLMTVEKLAELYIEHVKTYGGSRRRRATSADTGKKSWQEDQRILELDVLGPPDAPYWRYRKAVDIDADDVDAMLDRIEARARERGRAGIMANKTLAIVSGMYRYAITKRRLPKGSTNPCTGIGRRIDERQRARKRLLGRDEFGNANDDELRTIWQGLDDPDAPLSAPVRAALRLMFLTGQRGGEIRLMQWAHVKGDLWRQPPEITKTGRENVVPLSTAALAIVERWRGRHSTYVLPWGDSHMAKDALPRAVARWLGQRDPKTEADPERRRRAPISILNVDHWTPHDIRRWATSVLARSRVPRVVVDKLTNHSDSSITGAVYDQHDYIAEKREAVEILAAEIARVNAGNVVAIDSRRAAA
jgi:integrase